MDSKSLWRMRALFGALAAGVFDPWSVAVAQEVDSPPPAPSSPDPPISPPSTVPSPAASSAPPTSEAATSASEAVPPKKTQGLVLDGLIGGGVTSVVKEDKNAGVVVFGFTGLYHSQWFELGTSFTVQDTVFGFASVIFSGLAGVKADDLDNHVRYELLAEGGADFVGGVGGGILVNSVEHGSATLPYLGGRGGMSFLLGERHRFVLGVWTSAGEAIGTTVIHPVVNSCFLGCSSDTETYTIGGFSWTAGLRIGGEAAEW
jgi:hypothetical protein